MTRLNLFNDRERLSLGEADLFFPNKPSGSLCALGSVKNSRRKNKVFTSATEIARFVNKNSDHICVYFLGQNGNYRDIQAKEATTGGRRI